ncbi:SLAP domain-containing protein [Lactobacillus sp. PV037]|uniref:SLAP domain-containing protein n=1 Tax=Lactobacillus sp. PV037 TaxID=2594496 RepID=UPI00223F98A3|nr:SLAP domain-containing protein [Lactobacillus sp. PV037]
MKKNIKIASVTAAALLAVAPVVATGTANAAVTVNNTTATQPAPTQTAGTVTVNISLDATAGKTTVGEATKSAKVTVDGATVANSATGTGAYKVEIAKAGTTTALNDATKLEANQAYVVLVNGIKLKGLTTGNTYSIAGGTVAGKTTQTAEELNANNGVNFTSDSFYVFDKSLTGTPVVTNNDNKIVSSGSIALGNNTTVASLAKAITSAYKVQMPSSGEKVAKALDWSASAVENSVRSSLKNANVNVEKDGSFTAPATNFTVNLTGYASNGKTVSFPVTVTVANSTTTASDAPVFSTTNNDYKAVANSTNAWNLSLQLNSATNAQAIANAFTAKIDATSNLTTSVKVDSSNLNTAVAGKYTVVLSATNPSNNKTTKATVNVTVGDPGETKTVQAGSETAKVVTIDGNKVTETSTTLANDSKVATFGTVTVDGVSYTRLNSSSSNQFVATKYVDGSIKEEKKTEKTIMHKALIYDKDGKATKESIGAYNKVTVYGDIVTINGAKFYKLGENRFVKVGNIDGTMRTLKHNAYIYNNKLKRVQKNTVLKKGSEKRTYGSAFTIKGKKVYRIGENQYVKVANFK